MLVIRHAAVAYRVSRGQTNRPVPTKDPGVLRTVADGRDYMLALPQDREFKHHGQHTAKMILDQADVADGSRRVELALFYDGKLDLVALYG
jgi:hypothetical protein